MAPKLCFGWNFKNRVSSDSLYIFPWVAGICTITREENNVKTKMPCFSTLLNSWGMPKTLVGPQIKGTNALLVCRMEEGKIDMHMTNKIDRLRKTLKYHYPLKEKGAEFQGLPWKFYQNGKCSRKGDHTNNRQLYKYVCINCNTTGKRFVHPAKDCRNTKCQHDTITGKALK